MSDVTSTFFHIAEQPFVVEPKRLIVHAGSWNIEEAVRKLESGGRNFLRSWAYSWVETDFLSHEDTGPSIR